MIIEIDRERERVSLGSKQLADNLGKDRRTLPIGSTVKGKVVNLVPYGAFIDSRRRRRSRTRYGAFMDQAHFKPSEVLRIGEEVEACPRHPEGRAENLPRHCQLDKSLGNGPP